jgi:phosphoglycolate phosphatase
MYNTYLFDFDYTLANSEWVILTCYRKVLDRHGYAEVTDDDIRRTIGYTLQDSFRMMTGVVEQPVLEQYRREYAAEADIISRDHTLLYPETIPMLRKLKARNCHVGIISTKYRYRIMATLEKYEIVDLVDEIIGGEDVSVAKPDPQGVLEAIRRFGVTPADVLYVGDSIVDAQTAENAGVDFAAVTTGMTTAEDFIPYATVKIMKTLAEVD